MSVLDNKILKDYIDQVKKKMPEWLKWKEEQLKLILDDLKKQVIYEANQIAVGGEPTNKDFQEAIDHMGSPESIAKLYKRRGKPKYFITEELFEFYLRTLFFFWGIIILINIVVAVFQVFVSPWWEIIGSAFSGIWVGCLISAVVITIVFVYFSYEGFLPEDFGIFPKRLALIFPFNLTEEEMEETRESTKQTLEEAKILRDEKLAEAKTRRELQAEKLEEDTYLRKEKMAQAKTLRKAKLAQAKAKRALKEKEPVSLGELIFGAIGGLIFGLILILQPFSVLGLFNTEFLEWLTIFGLLVFINGLICLIRLAVGVSNHTGQQILIVITTIYNISYIPMLLFLLQHPEIFPIDVFTGGIITAIPNDISDIKFIIYFWVIIAIVIGIIGGMIGNYYKVYKLSRIKKEY
ncbi:MAG: hypothetical protein EU542_00270 [Promethearchaeota archaeon]|nr:MAG: hypothetical protein EU542_00270 [Candidatus Lokiarchaeota archaeon]